MRRANTDYGHQQFGRYFGAISENFRTNDCEVFLQLFLNSDLREVRKIKPDLIILDYYVGRQGVGWEFLQLLKMEDTTASIPVLICTTAVKLAQEIAPYLATKQVTILRKPSICLIGSDFKQPLTVTGKASKK